MVLQWWHVIGPPSGPLSWLWIRLLGPGHGDAKEWTEHVRFCWNWFQQAVSGMRMDMVRSFDDSPVGLALERKLEDLAGKIMSLTEEEDQKGFERR